MACKFNFMYKITAGLVDDPASREDLQVEFRHMRIFMVAGLNNLVKGGDSEFLTEQFKVVLLFKPFLCV